MYNTSELYQLSFVSPSRRPRTGPQIVFTVKTKHLDEINDRLRIRVTRYREHAEKYCSPETIFTYPVPDLFGHLEFGYGSCGLITIEDDYAHMRIELGSGERLLQCTLTIHLLTQVLADPMDDSHETNRPQQTEFLTSCEIVDFHAHAVGGHVSGAFMAWLREQGKQENSAAVTDVVRSMRQVWKAITRRKFHKWTKECDARIYSDGRFTLTCPGNACDLSIYPDSLYGDVDKFGVQFSCHNLDTADQQIILLAGFAKLCELARKSEEQKPPLL